MKLKDLIVLIGVPLIAGLFVYGIMALCYGPNPFYWNDDSKTIFIGLELTVPGVVFFATVSIVNKEI